MGVCVLRQPSFRILYTVSVDRVRGDLLLSGKAWKEQEQVPVAVLLECIYLEEGL